MMLLPPFISREKLARKYKCLDCRLLLSIDDTACPHCGMQITDEIRSQMRENHAKKVRRNVPSLILLAVAILVFIFWLGSAVN